VEFDKRFYERTLLPPQLKLIQEEMRVNMMLAVNNPVFKPLKPQLLLNVGADLLSKIDRVIYNDPATIIVWKDRTRTVVKKQKGDIYDAEKGLAMAFIKKVFENQGNYNDLFKKFGDEGKNE